MEYFTREEQPREGTAEQGVERMPDGYTTIFDRPEGTYEELSFLHEPIAEYKDDLSYIGKMLQHKRAMLVELEQKAREHESVAIGAFAMLHADLADKITKVKTDVHYLETLHTVTMQRLTMLIQEDELQKKELNGVVTKIEH